MNQLKTSEIDQVLTAFNFIIPILNKYQFKWVITGGFATLAHGVDRALTDIDIDINTSKDSPEFNKFLKDIEPFVTQPLEHFVDQNYDNYNVEVTFQNQLLDICPMAELKIFNKSTGLYENFYKNDFPKTELVDFYGLELPLLSKKEVIRNKEMLIWQRASDHKDITELRKLL